MMNFIFNFLMLIKNGHLIFLGCADLLLFIVIVYFTWMRIYILKFKFCSWLSAVFKKCKQVRILLNFCSSFFRFQWAIIEVLVLQIIRVVLLPLLFPTVFLPPVLRVLVQILLWVITPLMIRTIMYNSISRQVHYSINLNNSRWWVTSNCVNASSW